jgi:HAMP domain-containing protein
LERCPERFYGTAGHSARTLLTRCCLLSGIVTTVNLDSRPGPASPPDAERTNTSRIPPPGGLNIRLARPRTTVRWRLTLLYGALFLASGAALLAITYALVAHATLVLIKPQSPLGPVRPHSQHFYFVKAPARILAALRSAGGQILIKRVVARQQISDLHQLVIESGIALGIMALLSGLLGWVVAGRVLAPLRTITATTQEISDQRAIFTSASRWEAPRMS